MLRHVHNRRGSQHTIPSTVPSEVRLLEEMILHGCFVDGSCGRKEAKAQDADETGLGSRVDLKLPNHGYRQNGEEQICRNIDGWATS